MPLFRDSNEPPVSGWSLLVGGFIVYGCSAILMLLSPGAAMLLLLPTTIGGIMLAIGIIRVAVAGAMYRQEEQNRYIIELLKQINDKVESK
ncbi:MAG: hypothetical protein ACYC26_06800 [Phycisphaerales bacterium]